MVLNQLSSICKPLALTVDDDIQFFDLLSNEAYITIGIPGNGQICRGGQFQLFQANHLN
jgi:hypothetical protein